MAFSMWLLLGISVLSFLLAYGGASVGLVLGQFRLPLLILWLGSPVAGTATSLAISTSAAIVGAVGHARAGRVSGRLVLAMGVPSALAAFVAIDVASRTDPELIRALVGAVLVASGITLLLRSGGPASGARGAGAPEVARHPSRGVRLFAEVATGLVMGALSGTSGLLLGTLRLPILLRLREAPDTVVGSNMAIGCLTGALASVAAFTGGHVDWLAFSCITPPTVLGAYLGARATGRMQALGIRRAIASTLVLVGVTMALQGVWSASGRQRVSALERGGDLAEAEPRPERARGRAVGGRVDHDPPTSQHLR